MTVYPPSSPPLSFTVPGDPRPKQSTRFDGHGHAHTAPAVKVWQETVAQYAAIAMRDREIITGDVVVRLLFTLRQRRRADADNLSKAVLDSCNGIVYLDDNQVVELHIIKSHGKQPGVVVEIEEVWR